MGSNTAAMRLHRLEEAMTMPDKVRMIRRHYGHYGARRGSDVVEGNMATWSTDALDRIVGELSSFVQSEDRLVAVGHRQKSGRFGLDGAIILNSLIVLSCKMLQCTFIEVGPRLATISPDAVGAELANGILGLIRVTLGGQDRPASQVIRLA